MKKASVITVCFNSEKTIGRTLESVLNQSTSDFEYLIIDGLSEDSTLLIVEEYRAKFEQKGIDYRVYSEKDTGIYDAMDKGIGYAEGDVIAIINSDDWYESDAIETAIKEYEKNKYELYMCALYLWQGEKKKVKKPGVRKIKSSRDLCHPSLFVSRDGYKRIGLYRRDVFYADFDFWLRAFKKDARISVSDAVVANYVLGGVSNQKGFGKMIDRIKDRYAVYLRNGYSKFYLFETIGMEVAKMILA